MSLVLFLLRRGRRSDEPADIESGDALILEIGDFLLLENGDKLLLEA